MKKKLHRILFPGWGIDHNEYTRLYPDKIIDYGFFCEGQEPDLMNPDSVVNSIKPASPYVLIAHSMGSLFVLRNSQLRDNAEAIIIIGGFAKFAESKDNPNGKPAMEVTIMQKQLKRNPKIILKSFYRAMAHPEIIRIQIPEKPNVSQLYHGLELLKICDIRKDLNNLKVPVKIFHGEQDGIVSAKLAENLQKNIKKSDLKLFTNSGHALPLTHIEELKMEYQ